MAIQAPQHIRLKRKLHEQQVDLLYLPTDAISDADGADSNPKRQATRVFKLVNENGSNRTAQSNSSPGIAASSHTDTSTAVPRFVLTQSEPSRKRKLATFVAERPQKKVQVDHIVQEPLPPAAQPANVETSQESNRGSPRRRPGASTAVASKRSTKEDERVAIPLPTEAATQTAFTDLLAEAEQEDRRATDTLRQGSQHKFLPKTAIRAKDRRNGLVHGDQSSVVHGADGVGEYVYDTYVLDEVMEFDLQSALPGSVGVLFVGEEQQPVWETYLDESDSDEEQLSDDEDSNAEDYYGADYPEDELDSDDERDINAYQYRTHASDEEEYGSDAAAFSDQEDGHGIDSWR